MVCIEKEGKKFCEVKENGNILYVSVPEKFSGYPSDSWLAIGGVPPNVETYSSTHIFETARKRKEIAKKLAQLSGQSDWISRLQSRKQSI